MKGILYILFQRKTRQNEKKRTTKATLGLSVSGKAVVINARGKIGLVIFFLIRNEEKENQDTILPLGTKEHINWYT